MPGVFGVVGQHADLYAALREGHVGAWGPQEERILPVGRVGGHAFCSEAVVDHPDGSVLARDGVPRAHRADPGTSENAFCGNLVRLYEDGGAQLAADATGAFPLYWAELPGGLAFSSLLRPLARALGSSMDPVGVAAFLRYGYTFSGRTVFQGIHRLLPGETITHRAGRGLRREDWSDGWVSSLQSIGTPLEAAEALRDVLTRALATLVEHSGYMLMMSAGWDSRTLLAAATERSADGALHAYSHGDPGSRELGIARKLCDMAGVPWWARPIGSEVWEEDHLAWTFSRVENLVFPHWAAAGRWCGSERCIISGVLGEVLGGHYGRTQISQGRSKVVALLKGLDPRAGDEPPEGTEEEVARALSVGELERPWYLDAAAEDPVRLGRRLDEDIRLDLNRLVRRGVTGRDRLIEAFVTEHRGTQYICAQALSARAGADIAIPFGQPELFRLATSIPAHLKIHNRVNQALIGTMAPDLARFPMAATLVPAHWPLLAQEASRVVRKVYEEARWMLHRRSAGRAPPPRLGWVDFRFVREGGRLAELVDGLRSELWDHDALESLAARIRHVDGRQLHPIFDQLGKILTVDRLLSGTGP